MTRHEAQALVDAHYAAVVETTLASLHGGLTDDVRTRRRATEDALVAALVGGGS